MSHLNREFGDIGTSCTVLQISLWLMLGALMGCANVPRIYSGEAIHGWVIDAQTKQPIENVVVLEIWELHGYDSILQMEGSHNGNVHIAETLTDNNGYYSFPDWGPRFTMDGRMNKSAPRLVFYKFGYDDVQLRNTVSGNLSRNNRISEHSGKTIELEKHEGTPAEYEREIWQIHGILNLYSQRGELKCIWAKIPIFSAEMIKVGDYFRKNYVGSGAFPRFYSFPDNKCGPKEEILKDYLK